ncbi:MAG: multi-sensor signal transduction histidine kinase [Ramlibacter sp.]|jgi:signal transduction histidine kinase|nr:multi-sensor signal transduction histidine kinase [Ramlibacter sp.]
MNARSSGPPDKPVVLVVDDSPAYLSMLGAMLEDAYTVRVAASGQRALQLAALEPHPDLILLDVLMPDMDGHAVLTALRQDIRTCDIPAIFFTSLQEPGDELAGLSEGAADYIVKPAAPAVVKARVRAQIELKRMRDSLREHNIALELEIECRSRLEQALQNTIADLEAFSYSVSHDLRAPLSAVNAFAISLLETEADALSPRGRHRLERIVAGSTRMNQMIDDILACSRAERTEMRWQTVDLGAMAADTVAEMRHAWPATEVDIGPLPAVHADGCMARQILANLIGNAFKFSGSREGARVEISATQAGGIAEITVRDNGAGFDMAYSSKLFGLFQRLHSDAEFPGSGVGLAIVKRLVSRHGGTIRAESVPGGWTTFRFSFGARSAVTATEPASGERSLSLQVN